MDHAKSLIDLFIDQWDRVKLKKRHGLAKLIAWQKRAKLSIQPGSNSVKWLYRSSSIEGPANYSHSSFEDSQIFEDAVRVNFVVFS